MKQNTIAPSTCPAAKLTTEEFAVVLRIKPESIRASLCRHGHYLGLRPTKLPNGRLLWDASEVDRVASGEAAEA